MIPSQTFESFPVFSDTGTKVKPGDAKYSAGFQQSDVLPAEWVNWEWNKASKGITDLNEGMESVQAEINSVLTGAGKTADASKTNQLLESITKLIDDAETRAKLAAHPIGSLYWSSDSTNPGQLFGGTWAAIKDCFVWAKGDSDTVNATGGAKTVTLIEANLPSHRHSFTPSGSISGGAYKFTGSAVTSGEMSGSTSASMTGIWKALFRGVTVGGRCSVAGSNNGYAGGSEGTGTNSGFSINLSHTHSVTAAGSISITTNPSFSGTASNTGYTGSGTAHENMPPYIIKYCWERTA